MINQGEARGDASDMRSLADRLLEEHGSALAATGALVKLAEVDPGVLRKVVNGHLRSLCGGVIRLAVQGANGKCVAAAGLQRSSDVAAWAAAVEEGLMNSFRLPGGKLLGDSTRVDLLKGAQAYQALIGDMLVKSRWLKLLAEKMPDDTTTVRKALTEESLTETRAEARQLPRAA